MADPIIKGWLTCGRSLLIDETGYSGPYETTDYAPGPTSVQMPYVSGGLPAGYSDRFYVSGFDIYPSNYESTGQLAATITDTDATVVLLENLEPNTRYWVLGVRFDDQDQPTGVYSNREYVCTTQQAIKVTPANIDLTHDWQGNLSDFFHVNIWAIPGYNRFRKMSDGTLGNFVRVSNYYKWLVGEDSEGQYVYYSGSFILDGQVAVSPRHNWTIEIPYRVPEYGTKGDLGSMLQLGFNSGNVASFMLETYGSHGSEWHQSLIETPADLDGTGSISSATVSYQPWATVYPGDPDYGPRTLWCLHKPNDQAWQRPDDGSVTVLRFEYNASTNEVMVYNDDQLMLTLNDVYNDRVDRRRKYPSGHYALPVVPRIFWTYFTGLEDAFIDIGEVKIESDCPYAYGGFAVNMGNQISLFDPWGGYGNIEYIPYTNSVGVQFIDDTKIDLDDFVVYNPGDSTSQRYGINTYNGYTLKPSNWSSYEGEVLSALWPTGLTWEVDTPQVGMSLPMEVPDYHKAVKVAFQGLQQYGTLECRLVDQNRSPLTSWVSVTTVEASTVYDIPANSATAVHAEFRISYDGSTIDFTSDDYHSNTGQISGFPGCPSVFVGYEVYFEPPTTTAETDYNTIVLTNSSGLTIYWSWDSEGSFTEYTGPIDFQEGTLYAYGENAEYTEPLRSFDFALSTTTTAAPTTTTTAAPTTTTTTQAPGSGVELHVKAGGEVLSFSSDSNGPLRLKTSNGIYAFNLGGDGPLRIKTSQGVKSIQ